MMLAPWLGSPEEVTAQLLGRGSAPVLLTLTGALHDLVDPFPYPLYEFLLRLYQWNGIFSQMIWKLPFHQNPSGQQTTSFPSQCCR
jgi:hypothetical protein